MSVAISDLPRLQAWKEKGTLTVVDGVEIFSIATKDFGNSNNTKKPNLVIVHGFPTSSYDFWKIYPDLTNHFEVFCWDFCGFGFSQKVYRTIGQQIDLLEALLSQKGYTSPSSNNKLKTHILSHDLGDTLVQEMMARGDNIGADIQSVVMLNGGILPKMHKPTIVQKILLIPGLNMIGSLFAQNMSLFSWSISKVFGPHTKPTEEELKEYFALVMCNGGEALVTENIKYMTERQVFHDRWVEALQSHASNNPGRLILIDGPADPVSGRHLATAVQEQVPGAKVVLLDDAIGHWPQVEAPEETMKAILDFHREIKTFI